MPKCIELLDWDLEESLTFPGQIPGRLRQIPSMSIRANAKSVAWLAGFGVVLTLTQSGCIVVGGGYSSRSGWFIWPGGLGVVLILLLLFFVLRHGR
jgi:hypothetical protein